MLGVEYQERVAVITMNRPERRNAVDHPTLRELLEVQAELPGRDVRAVVLTGAPPAFSAGADLNGVEQGAFAADLHAVLTGFGALPMPVIAAVDGPALGAGSQLVVACDLRVATPASIFGIPAARLGIAVDRWTIDRLSTEFTSPVARAMLVAAEVYDAATLHGLGAIHRLGDLDSAVGWAHELAALAPLTIAAHKLGLDGADPAEFSAASHAAWDSADAAEGRTAFLEKRAAHFSGA